MKSIFAIIVLLFITISAQHVEIKKSLIDGEIKLPNTAAALDYEDDLIYKTNASKYIPIKDESFVEHVRSVLNADEEQRFEKLFIARSKKLAESKYSKLLNTSITSFMQRNEIVWIGTKHGLYIFNIETKEIVKHESYGLNGPLSTHISDIELDSKGVLWIGTLIGLSLQNPDGTWLSLRGPEGLPVEEINTLAIDPDNRIWIGTTQGAILYTPYEEGRQWYYRAGKRYLINDIIEDIEIADHGRSVYFKTDDGISKISEVERTLAQKADIIEKRLNKWHRRMGIVAGCVLNDAENPTSYTIGDNDNDGLWTSYHVVAMSLAYASTGNVAYMNSAKTSIHAMIMLQNASGIPGLVARSVVPITERESKSEQWRETPDGKLLWKSDTSNDEIDGHFFALYAYWEHIAKNDPIEAAIIKTQASTVMNYIIDNNYQLIDWDGKRTNWGFWNPELLNDDPEHYIENGLNSAQILSFLKVTYYITGHNKFKKHYDYLITEHGYLGNVLLEKKVFPDANNHSDNQLGFCALYPLLQLEYDPVGRNTLQRAVRRHYRTINRDGSAFFYFAAATIDLDFVDIKSAVVNLRQIPTDRRQWSMINSNRKDIVWSPYKTRFNRPQLLNILPADERNWGKWNGNPYYPDGGGDGRYEDDGASWLLAYWMGRYHGFIDDDE
jgi:Two component regulator propeller